MAGPGTRCGFIEALKVMLPDEVDTHLLRACLLDSGHAASDWAAWVTIAGDPQSSLENDRRGLKGLLPLIRDSVQRQNMDVSDEMRTYLRAAAFREELRWQAIETILGQIVRGLKERGVPFTLVGGAAAALSVYREPALRHCHDLKLYVGDGGPDALAALADVGFRKLKKTLAQTTLATFEHEDGLPVRVVADLAEHPCHAHRESDLDARSASISLVDQSIRVASPADQLLTILCQASTSPQRSNLRWACDAWLTIACSHDIDWTHTLSGVKSRRLALPATVLCRYLSDKLDAPIPEFVITELDAAARNADGIDREAALVGALQGITSARHFMSAADRRACLETVRFLTIPSRTCMAWTYGTEAAWRRLLRYVERPIRYLSSRLGKYFVKP